MPLQIFRELRNKSSSVLVCGTHQMLYQSHRQLRDNKKLRKLAVPLNIHHLRRKKSSCKHTRSVKGTPKTKKRVGCCSRRSKRSNSNSKETAENIGYTISVALLVYTLWCLTFDELLNFIMMSCNIQIVFFISYVSGSLLY